MNNILPEARIESLEASDLIVRRGKFVLEVPEFKASAGDVLALVGANGAGKTTFLSSVAGEIPFHSGQVEWAGIPISALGWQLPEIVRVVPDDLRGIPGQTLAAHLALLGELVSGWDHQYCRELATRLRLPLETKLKHLSRGNRVKAAFVSAESSSPPVLVLDEPTSGLDPEVRSELLAVLGDIHRMTPKRLVVFSTHILEDVAQVATSISLVRRGVVYPPVFGPRLTRWCDLDPRDRTRGLEGLFQVENFA